MTFIDIQISTFGQPQSCQTYNLRSGKELYLRSFIALGATFEILGTFQETEFPQKVPRSFHLGTLELSPSNRISTLASNFKAVYAYFLTQTPYLRPRKQASPYYSSVPVLLLLLLHLFIPAIHEKQGFLYSRAFVLAKTGCRVPN